MADVSVADLVRWLRRFDELVAEHRAELTELDSAIGDADHGTNLTRGTAAVAAALAADPAETIDALMRAAGMTLVSTVGGASGPLYGTLLLRIGAAAGTVTTLDAAGMGVALQAGRDGVVARGGAAPGDKTMVDALDPAVAAWISAAREGRAPSACAAAASSAAAAGRDATVPLVARKGRASYLGERSAGHADPGAASTALLFEALRSALAEAPEP